MNWKGLTKEKLSLLLTTESKTSQLTLNARNVTDGDFQDKRILTALTYDTIGLYPASVKLVKEIYHNMDISFELQFQSLLVNETNTFICSAIILI